MKRFQIKTKVSGEAYAVIYAKNEKEAIALMSDPSMKREICISNFKVIPSTIEILESREWRI